MAKLVEQGKNRLFARILYVEILSIIVRVTFHRFCKVQFLVITYCKLKTIGRLIKISRNYLKITQNGSYQIPKLLEIDKYHRQEYIENINTYFKY